MSDQQATSVVTYPHPHDTSVLVVDYLDKNGRLIATRNVRNLNQ